MASILTRTHRATFILAFGLIGLSLFSPMVAFANVDLGSGDQGTVTGDASLRSEPSYDAVIVAAIPDGTSVSILDGPMTASDGSLWYSVSTLDSAGYLPVGAIASAPSSSSDSSPEDMGEDLPDPTAATEDDVAEETPAGDGSAVSVAPEKEAIDYGVVVNNDEMSLPDDGLACRTGAATDAGIITRIPEGGSLEITGDELTIERVAFYPVNCAAQSGFVNGDYVVLASAQTESEASDATVEPTATAEVAVTEQVAVQTVEPTATVAAETAEPTAAVEEVVAQEPPVEGEVFEASPASGVEPVIDKDVVTDEVVATEAVVADSAVAEEDVVTDEVVATEAVVADPAVAEEAAVQTAEPTAIVEVVATEAVVADPAVTEEAAVQTAESTAIVEVVATEAVVADPAVTEEAAVQTAEPTAVVEVVATEAVAVQAIEPTTAVATETVVSEVEPTATVATETVVTEVVPSSTSVTVVFNESVTSAAIPATTPAAAVAAPARQRRGEAVSPARAVPSQTSVNTAQSIGSAEVQGTNGAGLRCRTAPNGTSPTITVLGESSWVLVHAEPRNGYLGVVCAGQDGWADVDYMWSGGADGATSSDFTTAAAYATISGTNGDGVRCRRGPSTSDAVIAIVPEGTMVATRGAASGGWVPINCYGYSGYVSASFITINGGSTAPAPAPLPSSGTAQVTGTGGGLRCRSAASLSGGIITILPDGTSIAVRSSASGGWLPVVCAGQNGFVSTQYVTGGDPAPTPTTPAPGGGSTTVIGWGNISGTGGQGVRCRSAASTSASVIAVIPEGTQVGLRGAASGGWMPVNCYGYSGFVSAMYVYVGSGSAPAPAPPPPPTAPTGMVANDNAKTASDVNLRYSASTGAGIAAVVPAGTVVKITGSATNNFYPVDWDSLRGFLSADYLIKTSEALSKRGGSAAPAPPTTDGGTTATGNAMADFALRYQGYPYRWANHGPSAFDCSGFTYWVTKNVTGKDIGYGLWTQATAGTPVSRANIQPGDLVFFQNTYKAGLSHSGVYIGNNQFIHAENETTGVRISDLNSTYYGSRWYGAVRMT